MSADHVLGDRREKSMQLTRVPIRVDGDRTSAPPVFDYLKEQKVWENSMRALQSMLEPLQACSRKGKKKQTGLEIKLVGLVEKFENLVMQSILTESVIGNHTLDSRLVHITAQRLARSWNAFCENGKDSRAIETLGMHVDELCSALSHLLSESRRAEVNSTTGLSWSEFIQIVSAMLANRDFRIIDTRSVARPLGGFLKISSHRFIHADFEDLWPLWSSEVMDNVEEITGLSIPCAQIKRHLHDPKDIVLIGVGGCGKSRTCYDICRFGGKFCVFLDCVHHVDVDHFLRSLPFPPTEFRRNCDSSVAKFHKTVGLATMRFLLSRLVVLKKMLEANGAFSPDDFFQMQQLSRSKRLDVFRDVLEALQRVRDEEIESQFKAAKSWFADMDELRFVLDESHRLLDIHRGLFHSSSSYAVNAIGEYVEPRSYFSYLAMFFAENQMNVVWAGTHLRIGDITRITSAGSTARRRLRSLNPIVFTDFNYLTPKHISQLLEKWVVIYDEALKIRISQTLQGRPRLLMEFLIDLYNFRGTVSDENLSQLFESVVPEFEQSFIQSWKTAWKSTIQQFVPDVGQSSPVHTVGALLEDLLYNDYITDTRKNAHADWYRAMVATGLVMLSKVDCESGLICEPLVIRAGIQFGRLYLNRNLPMDTILNRDLSMESDESGRGRAVESLCVVQLRDCFWKREGFRDYFPDELNCIVDHGGISPPIGIHDCRTGVKNHTEKLRNSFLSPDATHVVLTNAKQGAADVVYGYFTFHVKTKWTDINQKNKLVISNAVAKANAATIDKTWLSDTQLADRVATRPWVCICFEFPINAELHKDEKTEKIEKKGMWTTITASINSQFARLFFGDQAINRIKLLTFGTENT